MCYSQYLYKSLARNSSTSSLFWKVHILFLINFLNIKISKTSFKFLKNIRNTLNNLKITQRCLFTWWIGMAACAWLGACHVLISLRWGVCRVLTSQWSCCAVLATYLVHLCVLRLRQCSNNTMCRANLLAALTS